jgi:hypothetical protein
MKKSIECENQNLKEEGTHQAINLFVRPHKSSISGRQNLFNLDNSNSGSSFSTIFRYSVLSCQLPYFQQIDIYGHLNIHSHQIIVLSVNDEA